MSSLLLNPTADQIDTTLASQLDGANRGARTRQISVDSIGHWATHILTTPTGTLYRHGGRVANSYRGRAESTAVRAAWWTDGRGRKHVLLSASRVDAGRCSYGRCEWEERAEDNAWASVFPDRSGRLYTARLNRIERLLDRVGPEGSDDRLSILRRERHLVAISPEGLILSDHPTRPKVVQVVVRDTTTGQRHHITVPPKFATRASKTYQKLGSSAARVHAAIAWTFALAPEAYAPTAEA